LILQTAAGLQQQLCYTTWDLSSFSWMDEAWQVKLTAGHGWAQLDSRLNQSALGWLDCRHARKQGQ
jgi:hypothetical protein